MTLNFPSIHHNDQIDQLINDQLDGWASCANPVGILAEKQHDIHWDVAHKTNMIQTKWTFFQVDAYYIILFIYS